MNISVHGRNNAAARVWGSTGARYDEISRGIADAIEHCVERLLPKPGERILDIATGTGWTARRLAERGAEVSAIDFAPGMVAAAWDLAQRRNLDIAFEVGDAETLDYVDQSFDAVISTFGVMFSSQPEQAASELTRVCRPGGRLALTVWTPDGTLSGMFEVMKPYMSQPVSDPPPSPFEWGNPERVQALLGDTFDLTFERGTSFYREPSGLQAWETFSSGYGPLLTLAAGLDEGARESLKRDFVAFHDAYASELGVCVPRDYWVVIGKRR